MDEATFVILGANGQLGTALKEQYPRATALSSSDMDISDPVAVQNFDWSNTQVIINAAAYTNVDGAETPEGRVTAWKVNAQGARNLATVAIEHELTLIHISSEYVFDGTQAPHTENEPLSPLGVYANSKAAGDVAVSLCPKHYILRTSWVIGEGKNFVRIMLGLGQKGVAPTVVSDQVGRLTFTSELTRVIDHLLHANPLYGTYNVSNSGNSISWADVTRKIFELGGFNLIVTNTTTTEYFAGKPGAAPRPLQSTLDLGKLEATGFVSRDWQDDLAVYIDTEKDNERGEETITS